MIDVEMNYAHLNTDEVRGTTQADYLIGLDADFRVVVEGDIVYAEPGFPVVELAQSLREWLDEPDGGDFEFNSMSFEEIGSVAFRQSPIGWKFQSVFVPDSPFAPVEWAQIDACCRDLIARVASDLVVLGLTPTDILGSDHTANRQARPHI